MRIVADNITKNEDGTMEVTISFNPFEHGHSLGTARNYDRDLYEKMVNAEETKLHIANGYALGGYTHDNRDKIGTIKSSDANGNPVMPCCKTISMEFIPPNTVKHTQRILNNKIGKEVQTLLESGVGGFSSAHNLKTSSFYGFDYVIYPNFTTNRAVVDNICNGGACSIGGAELDSIVRNNIESYFDSISGSYEEDTVEMILDLEKTTGSYATIKSMMEKSAAEKYSASFDEIDALKYDFEKRESELKGLLAQLDGFGLEIKSDKIVKSDNILGKLFKSKKIEDIEKSQFDDIMMIKLKKQSKKQRR